MTIKNTASQYGIVTKLVHGIIALLFITQFVLVYWRDYTMEGTYLNLQLVLLHKSFGFTLLFIGLFFIVWRFLNTKPSYPSSMARWEVILATATHHSLYLVIFLMPLTGVYMSMASGKGLKWFGMAVPNLINLNKPMAGYAYNAHLWISYIVIGLVVLHVIGALKHYFMNKNNVLQRMWA